ncbi:MAG TPA: peptidylprolyl isomerase [Thermoanaerobaculia bacterium]|jgi:peptidyl-prolyl cis-trans isomerase C|nr:peptidylprolyl isomerase [Thermoanaerobaculia bacterium]
MPSATSSRRIFLAACLGLADLGACKRTPPPAPDAVARIDREELRYPQFRIYVSEVVGQSAGLLASDVLSALFDQFLDERLLEHMATERKLAPPEPDPAAPSGESAGRRGRRGIDALLAAEVAEPTEPEIDVYYRDHGAEFARPERVRLRQVLVERRSEAERALGYLAAGADFAEIARKYSRDPSAERGGDQGELAASDLPAAFAEVIFRLQPGQVSPVVPADYGFHIFQVTEHFPAETIPLERARAEIRRRLRRERADLVVGKLVSEARHRYNVDIYARNLPFEYRGVYRDPNDSKKTARR